MFNVLTAIGWLWYSTRDSVLQHIPGATVNVESDVWAAVVDPRTATGSYVASMRMTPLFTPYRRGKLGGVGSTSNYGRVPWETRSAGFGNAWWGDYSNGVTWLGKAFFGAWADARDLRFGARVYGASFGV